MRKKINTTNFNFVKKDSIIVVWDMEFNSYESDDFRSYEFINETIQIGAVKVKNGVVIEEFNTYVRPIIHPILTTFIKDFTGITQEQVDKAPIFREALKDFIKWCGEADVFTSCGKDDYFQLLKEIKSNGIKEEKFVDKLINNYFDLKDYAKKSLGLDYRVGLDRMLRILRLDFEGSKHNALDDAFNTAKVLQRVL